jgi:hypothetical protein
MTTTKLGKYLLQPEGAQRAFSSVASLLILTALLVPGSLVLYIRFVLGFDATFSATLESIVNTFVTVTSQPATVLVGAAEAVPVLLTQVLFLSNKKTLSKTGVFALWLILTILILSLLGFSLIDPNDPDQAQNIPGAEAALLALDRACENAFRVAVFYGSILLGFRRF